MTVKCTYIPNRTVPREFTPNDAARVICRLLAKGIERSTIEDAIRSRELSFDEDTKEPLCDGWTGEDEEKRDECEDRLRQAKAAVAQIQQRSELTAAVAERSLGFIIIQLLAAVGLIRAIPIIGPPAALAVRQQVARLENVAATIRNSRAANDELFRQIVNL